MESKEIIGYVCEFSCDVDHNYLTIYNGEKNRRIEFKDCDLAFPLFTQLRLTIEVIDKSPSA